MVSLSLHCFFLFSWTLSCFLLLNFLFEMVCMCSATRYVWSSVDQIISCVFYFDIFCSKLTTFGLLEFIQFTKKPFFWIRSIIYVGSLVLSYYYYYHVCFGFLNVLNVWFCFVLFCFILFWTDIHFRLVWSFVYLFICFIGLKILK